MPGCTFLEILLVLGFLKKNTNTVFIPEYIWYVYKYRTWKKRKICYIVDGSKSDKPQVQKKGTAPTVPFFTA